jgi:hypothetical protein
MLLLHYSSVARLNRMWDLKKTWHLFENGSAHMHKLLVPGFLDNQLCASLRRAKVSTDLPWYLLLGTLA